MLARHSWFVALAIVGAAQTAQNAQAQDLRYSHTAPGGIVATGNTLGLSKGLNQNGPGMEDSIGTFLTLDTTSVDNIPANTSNPWPAGTTWDWMQNGSSAVLTLPMRSEVLYAELVWAGSYLYIEDVTAFLDTPVSLSFGTDSLTIAPDPATALTIAEMSSQAFAANYYLRSAEVTAFVDQHGSGTYRVEGVPATQTDTINSLNAAGWSLVVVYRADAEPIRNLTVFVGGSFVDEDSQQDYQVSGFCAPPFGPVEGSVVVSALEGDADLVGDDLLIAPTDTGPFVSLSGPNNPETNFFCSQINDDSGALDTQGTFGNANHDAMNGVNVIGGRQGWDVTTIPLDSMAGHLSNMQTSAVVRTNTTGDSFVPVLMALELDVSSPDFGTGSSTTADKPTVTVGDNVTVTIVLNNSGEALADNLTLTMSVDGGLDLTAFTTEGMTGDITGAPVTEQDLSSGVDAGQLMVGAQRTMVATFAVVAGPDNGASFQFEPVFEHSFTVCDGDPPIEESHSAPVAVVGFDPGTSGVGGSTTTSGSSAGGGTSSGGSTGTGAPADTETAGDDGGCGCTMPGRRHAAPWLLFATAVLAVRRRRR